MSSSTDAAIICHPLPSRLIKPLRVLKGEVPEPPLHVLKRCEGLRSCTVASLVFDTHVDVGDTRPDPSTLEVLHDLGGNLCQNVLRRHEEEKKM